eukprot:7455204-Pyramimonas_sp.AAC.1
MGALVALWALGRAGCNAAAVVGLRWMTLWTKTESRSFFDSESLSSSSTQLQVTMIELGVKKVETIVF